MQLDLFAFVGVIMLVGLVKKNAIMMIDFALDAQRTEGKTPAEAIFEGAIIRFRPIMMTTMAALMGMLPIALGVGAGAESRRPLGVAVVVAWSSPVPHPVHHAGRLYLHGKLPGLAAVMAQSASSGGGGRGGHHTSGQRPGAGTPPSSLLDAHSFRLKDHTSGKQAIQKVA